MRWSLKARVSLYLVGAMLTSTAAAVGVAAYVQSDRLRTNAAAEAVSLSTTLSNGIVATEAAMEQQMLVAARMVVNEDSRRPLTNSDLNALVGPTTMQYLYMANAEGVFTEATDAGSIGFHLYTVAPAYKDLVTGKSGVISEPMKLRAEDGSSTKFLAIPRFPASRGFAEVGSALTPSSSWFRMPFSSSRRSPGSSWSVGVRIFYRRGCADNADLEHRG